MNSRLLACVLFSCAACASSELSKSSPPLARMHEPLDRIEEPDDEAARRALALGSFTGAVVGDARASLDEMLEAPRGVSVVAIVENSPAAVAGVEVGDLIVEARPGGASAASLAIAWPSDWRKVELETPPATPIAIVIDRAGAELELALTTVARVAPPARTESQRWREEARVGIVVRTATEVEARAANLGPGGGAVVVGLSADSPWRASASATETKLVYGDLIRAVDGDPLAAPQVLLDKIRAADEDAKLALAVVREGRELSLELPVSRRAQELKRVSIPLLYKFERDRDARTTSVLLGLFRWRRTPAAWDVRFLWFISFSGGDSDHLETVTE